MARLTLTLPPLTGQDRAPSRQGVPPALAARYAERAVQPRKGRGSYTRKRGFKVEG